MTSRRSRRSSSRVRSPARQSPLPPASSVLTSAGAYGLAGSPISPLYIAPTAAQVQSGVTFGVDQIGSFAGSTGGGSGVTDASVQADALAALNGLGINQALVNLITTNLDAKVSTRFAGGAVTSVTNPVTVGTNLDKSDYLLGGRRPRIGPGHARGERDAGPGEPLLPDRRRVGRADVVRPRRRRFAVRRGPLGLVDRAGDGSRRADPVERPDDGSPDDRGRMAGGGSRRSGRATR